MQNLPSRSDRRQVRLKFRAEKGLFTSEETLYKTEAKKLISHGFSVVKMTETEIRKGLGFYLVSWEHPYGAMVPQEIENYIMGNSDYSSDFVKTSAQSLYIIARKVSSKI